MSSRYHHGATRHGLRKLLCRHSLSEQKALYQLEAHLAHRNKVGACLHALGDGACAKAVSEVEDSAANRLFKPIVRAASDECLIDFDLDERKVVKSDERRPFRPEIVDRDGDIVKPKLPGDIFHKLQVTNDIGPVDLDDQPSGEPQRVDMTHSVTKS